MTKQKAEKVEDAAVVCSKAEGCIHAGEDCTEAGGSGREFACFGTDEDEQVKEVAEQPVEESVFVCDETSPTFTRILPVALTAEEQAVMGAEMARLIGIWTKAKLDKQAFDKSMKNLIDTTEEDYISIALKATDGTEDRPTECYWQMDRQHGLKRLYRCDTGALVEEMNMELLDYKSDGDGDLEESIKNVESMAQGQAGDTPEVKSGQPDSITADNLFDDPESEDGPSDDEWPEPPEQ